MISTKFRKEQKKRAKEVVAAKRASKDPLKDRTRWNKKDHREKMARRNEKIRQRGLFLIAERKRQIEKLKAIIEENKQRKLAEELAGTQQEETQNEIGEVYQGLLDRPDDTVSDAVIEEERHIGPGFTDFINEGKLLEYKPEEDSRENDFLISEEPI